MSVLNQCGEEAAECPLCMEHLEVDDLNFFPCTCGYQICRFCWHRIRTDENGLCPACRKAYPENPADFRPLTSAEVQKLKVEKRQKDQQRKQKVTESRQHLAAVRVVQRNLVFVVGLSPRLADGDVLKKHEYFGKFGKILKVVINPSNSYAGVQGPSASAYVTYVRREDALRAIAAVNNISVDGRLLKASLGTTKYCSNFLKNQSCPKPDCMYLHELGDSEASFTKDDMQQGKHQEYERKLHEQLQSQSKEPLCNGIHTPSINNINSNNNDNINNNNDDDVKETWPCLQDDQEASSSNSSSPAPPLEATKQNGQKIKSLMDEKELERNAKELSPVHQQAPSPSSSTSSLSGGPSPSTMQQSQSLSSSSSSISEDVLQTNASETQVALDDIHKFADNSFFSSDNPMKRDYGIQQIGHQTREPPKEMMQENLMPLLNSFNWQTAFGFSTPEENTNSRAQSKDIDDDLGFDPFAETQKALEELIKTEQQQQVVRQQQQQQLMQQQMQQQHRPAPIQPPMTQMRAPMVMDPSLNRSAPPPGFSNHPMRHNIHAQSSKILPILNMGQSGNGVVGKESSAFNMAHWRHILPNIGSGSSSFSNGVAHRHQMQAQQRDWQNDWTAMDPAIVAASASPRMTVDHSWNKQMDQTSIYQHSNNSLGWSGVMPNLATAPPPGFSPNYRVASRGGPPSAMDSELKSLLHQLH